MLVESVNARDPALIEHADVADTTELEESIRVMNERWPRMMMTRGDLGEIPVAVVWMPDEQERYRQVAHVRVASEESGAHAEMVDGVDPEIVAEEPPGLTVAEWESAREMDHGGGRWT